MHMDAYTFPLAGGIISYRLWSKRRLRWGMMIVATGKKNILATKEPKLSKQWPPTIIGGLMPSNVTTSSSRKV